MPSFFYFFLISYYLLVFYDFIIGGKRGRCREDRRQEQKRYIPFLETNSRRIIRNNWKSSMYMSSRWYTWFFIFLFFFFLMNRSSLGQITCKCNLLYEWTTWPYFRFDGFRNPESINVLELWILQEYFFVSVNHFRKSSPWSYGKQKKGNKVHVK